MLPLPAGEEMEQGAATQAEGAAEAPSAHTAPQQPQVWRRASPPRPKAAPPDGPAEPLAASAWHPLRPCCLAVCHC